ncbi:MAG: winged helix-turn-helix transcriptional regulator [Candidatus Zixiibacteriota bacterium]|nr:MAG: winged helix-turn-helix transcriptional regulator [candidate division Zixibacteria bacterium]
MDDCCTIDEKLYSRLFKAFGDKSRLKIIALLASKEMTVNDIAKAVGLSQPTVSRHLGILKDANLVVDRRDKQRVFYTLKKDSVQTCCTGFCDCLEIKEVTGKKEDNKK